MAYPSAAEFGNLGAFTVQLNAGIGGSCSYESQRMSPPDEDKFAYMLSKVQYGPLPHQMIGIKITSRMINLHGYNIGLIYGSDPIRLTECVGAVAITGLSMTPLESEGDVLVVLTTDVGSVSVTIHGGASVVCPIDLEI